MKKKILAVVLGSILLLSGCGKTIVNEQGETVRQFGDFIEISKVDYKDQSGNCGYQYIVYDRCTKVVYVMISASYRLSMSPYYIINENGEPEIAVFGENYK